MACHLYSSYLLEQMTHLYWRACWSWDFLLIRFLCSIAAAAAAGVWLFKRIKKYELNVYFKQEPTHSHTCWATCWPMDRLSAERLLAWLTYSPTCMADGLWHYNQWPITQPADIQTDWLPNSLTDWRIDWLNNQQLQQMQQLQQSINWLNYQQPTDRMPDSLQQLAGVLTHWLSDSLTDTSDWLAHRLCLADQSRHEG